MSFRNRVHNCTNPYQGDHKRVLCVCSAGLLRSPTAAVVLSQAPFHHNTRAVGLSADYALITLDAVHVLWAQEIVVMTPSQREEVIDLFGKDHTLPPITVLGIEDNYGYRDPELMRKISEYYTAAHHTN